MMSNEQQDFNDYLNKAKKWYASNYIDRYSSVFYLFIITSIILISFIIVLFTVFHKPQLKEKDFIVYNDNESVFSNKIRFLPRYERNYNANVAAFLLTYYIELRESYDSDIILNINYNKLMNSISSMSSNKCLDEFKNYMDPEVNSESPMISSQYKSKFIIVKSIDFAKYENKPTSATVFFDVFIKDKITNDIISKSQECVKINFTMNDIDEIIAKKKDLNFLIFSYEKIL